MPFLLIVLVTQCCVFVLLITLIIRNNKVKHHRLKMLQQVHDMSMLDVNSEVFNWEWRYNEFNAISYQQMVFQFWKPLDSFYPDTKFLEPHIEIYKN